MILNSFLFSFITFINPVSQGDTITDQYQNSNNIRVELQLNAKQLKDSGKVSYQSVIYILTPNKKVEVKKPQNGSLQIDMNSDEPVYLNFIDVLRVNKSGYYLAEPGDKVVISSNGDGFRFTGDGAAKYQFQYQLDSLEKSIPRMNKKTGSASFYLDSLEEYFEWTRYYQQKFDLALPLLIKYKGTMSDYSFSAIADGYITRVITSLSGKFHTLKENGIANKKISNESLIQIYDTSYSKVLQSWISHAVNKEVVGLELRTHQIQRAYAFDSLRAPSYNEMKILLLKDALKVYKGKERERFIVYYLPKTMGNIGFTPEIEEILTSYYAETSYPEWKKWMKEQELTLRVSALGYKSPSFSVTDPYGKIVTEKDLKGKIVVLNFYDEGTSGMNMGQHVVKKAVERFKNHPDVAFVNVFSGKNTTRWQTSFTQNKFKNVLNVSTGGLGTAHSIIKDFAVGAFPWIWVIDSSGKVIDANPKVDFTKDNGAMLAAFIQKRIDFNKAEYQKSISFKKDGPYVLQSGDALTAYSIDDTKLITKIIDKNKTQQHQLPVQTDLDQVFNVQLQTSVTVQPSIYPAAEKLLVLSDIEGNFDAFRKLLQKNKIIDEQFNWIFGNGHLVFAGDMFDRGMQVTECLWLMYSLEEKAKAAGGYVHYILGNHEIMNMQGNHYYTANKYKKNAGLIGKTLTELYNENSELGRWLRTKNIIEKIGDLLFVHGGISPEMNRLPLGIEDINLLARPYYGKAVDSANKNLLNIYDSRYGEKYRISPFWSRSYYKYRSTYNIGKISDQQLDTTLNKFDVRRIVTGHTIVADTISVHYEGKVINTDTHHARGLSEALFIEGDRYYRVNDKGEKILLFIDDKLRKS